MKNPLVEHGALRLSEDKKYLEHADGLPFFWLADTWWYGMTRRMPMPVFKKMAADRRKKGFTVIQVVVGVPPEIEAFSPDAGNSGGLPFHPDKTLNLAYFREVDRKIKHLVDSGLVPCIVGGWGGQIDSLGVRAIKQLWKEIVDRYAKYPVVFCVCGEADIFSIPTKPILNKLLSLAPTWLNSGLRKTKRVIIGDFKNQRLNQRLQANRSVPPASDRPYPSAHYRRKTFSRVQLVGYRQFTVRACQRAGGFYGRYNFRKPRVWSADY